MLQSAQTEKAKGIDVVIGYVEPTAERNRNFNEEP